jgi:hypothetical protein
MARQSVLFERFEVAVYRCDVKPQAVGDVLGRDRPVHSEQGLQHESAGGRETQTPLPQRVNSIGEIGERHPRGVGSCCHDRLSLGRANRDAPRLVLVLVLKGRLMNVRVRVGLADVLVLVLVFDMIVLVGGMRICISECCAQPCPASAWMSESGLPWGSYWPVWMLVILPLGSMNTVVGRPSRPPGSRDRNWLPVAWVAGELTGWWCVDLAKDPRQNY